jgi:putative membrane protein
MMYWNGEMGAWGYILMGLSFVAFWGAVVTALILVIRSMGPANRRDEDQNREGNPEDLLAARFARGEIDESEYTARLAVLRRGRGR